MLMSVQKEKNVAESVVSEAHAGDSVYASLFEKINLNPVSALSALDIWQDPQAMSEASADERLTAGMQVFMECLAKAGTQVEKLDKALIDHHIAELDYQISRQLDAVLHHPEFQKVESLWRGVKSLVDKTDFRRNVKIELLDLSKDDLRQDFEDAPEIIQSGLYLQTYVAEYDTPGGEPIAALVSAWEFDASAQDVALLKNISRVAASAHMPFIGSVGPAFFQKETMEEVAAIKDIGNHFERAEYIKWNAFRETDDARYIGLVMPRVLGRLPYGPDTRWQTTIVDQWNKAFAGRYPFKATGSDASLPLLAQFLRSDSGRITTFLKTHLGGLLHQEGSRWVVDPSVSQGMVVSPDFLRAINQLAELSDIVFSQGDAGVHFELMARPSRDVARVQLTLDEQNLDYFNQMESWQSFTWPGNTYYPGVSLTWRSVSSGMQLYASHQGNWGFIRLLDEALITPLDASRTQLVWITADGNPLKFVMRSELGDGPLALLKLQGFTLPTAIFSVAAGTEGVE